MKIRADWEGPKCPSFISEASHLLSPQDGVLTLAFYRFSYKNLSCPEHCVADSSSRSGFYSWRWPSTRAVLLSSGSNRKMMISALEKWFRTFFRLQLCWEPSSRRVVLRGKQECFLGGWGGGQGARRQRDSCLTGGYVSSSLFRYFH